MNWKCLLPLFCFLILSPVMAVSGEVLIDDFEDGDVSGWSMLWGDQPSSEQNITLSTFSHSDDYSVLLWDNREGPAVDFSKESIGISLQQPFSYYNISFWYYAVVPCSYPTNSFKHRIYLSDESSFLFKAVRIDSGDIMSCGEWKYIALSIEDNLVETLGSFSLDSTSLGSIMIENWHNGVYYDDIKLIPSIPEDTGGGCDPNWSCSDWGDCVSDVQTRNCTDLNDCGDESGMPSLQISCGVVIQVLEPTVTTYSPGQTITLTVTVGYPNGTEVSNLDLSLSAFGVEIPLSETEPGTYSVMMVPDENDIGEWDVSFSGIEDYQFSGLRVEVREASFGNATSLFSDIVSILSSLTNSLISLLYDFWYVVVISILILFVAIFFWKRPKAKKPKIRKEKKEIKREEPKKQKPEKKPKKRKERPKKRREKPDEGLHEVKL